MIKIYRNQIFSPQQMQALATNNNNNTNSNSMQFVYPLFNFVSASMFGKALKRFYFNSFFVNRFK
jgi:hypothetical protein